MKKLYEVYVKELNEVKKCEVIKDLYDSLIYLYNIVIRYCMNKLDLIKSKKKLMYKIKVELYSVILEYSLNELISLSIIKDVEKIIEENK